MDYLGITYTPQATYNRMTVPLAVWSKINEYTVKKENQESIIDAVTRNNLLTPQQQDDLKKLRVLLPVL